MDCGKKKRIRWLRPYPFHKSYFHDSTLTQRCIPCYEIWIEELSQKPWNQPGYISGEQHQTRIV